MLCKVRYFTMSQGKKRTQTKRFICLNNHTVPTYVISRNTEVSYNSCRYNFNRRYISNPIIREATSEKYLDCKLRYRTWISDVNLKIFSTFIFHICISQTYPLRDQLCVHTI